jgi:hypothetical protein
MYVVDTFQKVISETGLALLNPTRQSLYCDILAVGLGSNCKRIVAKSDNQGAKTVAKHKPLRVMLARNQEMPLSRH